MEHLILIMAALGGQLVDLLLNYPKHAPDINKGVFENNGNPLSVLWHYIKRRLDSLLVTAIILIIVILFAGKGIAEFLQIGNNGIKYIWFLIGYSGQQGIRDVLSSAMQKNKLRQPKQEEEKVE